MKIIDEKGKLFGKLNVIDLLVIVLIIAAVVVVGIKFLGGGSGSGATGAKLTYIVHATAWDEDAAEQIGEFVDAKTGKKDQLLAGSALLDAYVVDYWTEPSSYNRLNTGSVEMLDPEAAAAAGLVDVYFKIEASVANTATNEVGTQQVRVGKTHIIKTTHMEFDCGIVEECVWEPLA